MRRKPITTEAQFWEYVDKQFGEDACWLWIGKLCHGYGRVGPYSAHRLAWLYCRGEIPDGLFVLHACDVTQCVNPKHLFLGTHADNMRDMYQKGRNNREAQSRSGRMHKGLRHSEQAKQKMRVGMFEVWRIRKAIQNA